MNPIQLPQISSQLPPISIAAPPQTQATEEAQRPEQTQATLNSPITSPENPESQNQVQQRPQFGAFDPNAFQMPTAAEQQQQQQALNKLNSTDARSILNRVDHNQDGNLSLQELQSLDLESSIKLADSLNVKDFRNNISQLSSHLQYLQSQNTSPTTDVLSQNNRAIFDGIVAASEEQPQALLQAARKLPPAEVQQRQDNLLQQTPEWTELLDNVSQEAPLTGDVLLALENINDRMAPQARQNIAAQINDFVTQGTGDLSPAERQEFARDLLIDLGCPDCIRQGSKATCAGVTAQMKLAQRNPERYVEIGLQLAQNQNVDLGTGTPLRPNRTFVGDTSDTRSLSGKIIQNALLNYGRERGDTLSASDPNFEALESYTSNGQPVFFDSRISTDPAQPNARANAQAFRNDPDVIAAYNNGASSDLEFIGEGLVAIESQVLESELLGENVDLVHVADVNQNMNQADQNALIDRIQSSLEQGRSVTIDISIDRAVALGRNVDYANQINTAEHSATLVGLTSSTPPEFILSSWGNSYTLSADDLRQLMTAARF